MQGLQANDRGRAESSSPLQVSVQAPHICAVVVLPPPPSGFQTCGSCHGNSYMALDLFAAAHMVRLLLRMTTCSQHMTNVFYDGDTPLHWML